MENNIFRVYGRIIRSDAKTGVHGLLVEVFDKDLIFDDRLGSVYTSRAGRFSITYRKSDFADLFELQPEIYVQVRDRDGMLIYTAEETHPIRPDGTMLLEIILDEHILANHFSRPVSWERTDGRLLPREKLRQIEQALLLLSKPEAPGEIDYLKASLCPLPPIDNFEGILDDAWEVLEGDPEASIRFRDTLDLLDRLSLGRKNNRAQSPAEDSIDFFSEEQFKSLSEKLAERKGRAAVSEPLIGHSRYVPLVLASIHVAGAQPQSVNRYLGIVHDQLCGYGPIEAIHRAAGGALQGDANGVNFLKNFLEIVSEGCGPDDFSCPRHWPPDDLSIQERLACTFDYLKGYRIPYRRPGPSRRGIPTYIIESVEPSRACAGENITISGTDFGEEPGILRFTRGGVRSSDRYVEAYVESGNWSDTEITVTVPEEAGCGPLSLRIYLGTIPVCDRYVDILKYGDSFDAEVGLPTISSFQANGRTELTVEPNTEVTLTWSVCGADTLRLRRTTTFGGPNVDITNPLGNSYPLGRFSDLHPIDATYELTAENNCGRITSTVTIRLRRTPALQILGVEVIQAIQRFSLTDPTDNNSVRLVARKRTIARVYVDSGIRDGFRGGGGANPNQQANVTGEITILLEDSGRRIPAGTPLNPRGEFIARPREDIHRENLTNTLNFELPHEELSGRVQIRTDVWVRDHWRGESSWSASEAGTLVNFQPRRSQIVVPILVQVRNSPSIISSNPPTRDQYDLSLQAARIRFPIAEDGFLVDIAPGFQRIFTDRDLESSEGWRDLLDDIADIAALHIDVGQFWTALVPRGRTFAFAGLSVRAERVMSAQATLPASLAHEMGHLYNFGHAPCPPDIEGVDRRLPPRTEDVGLNVVGTGGTWPTIVPAGTSELMGYCDLEGLRWPSIVFWETIFDILAR